MIGAVVVLLLVIGGVAFGFALTGDDDEGDDSAGDDSSQSDGPSEGPATAETSDVPESPVTSEAPDVPSPVEPADPVVGDCYALTAADLALAVNESPVVDCGSGEATAQTIYVGALSSSDDAALATAGSTCYRQVADVLGIEPRLIYRSLASWVFFRADDAQFAAGAGSYRCDLVFAEGADKLLPLPADVSAVYDGDSVARAYEACLGTVNDRVRCSSTEATYTWTAAYDRPGVARRPKDAAMVRWARPRCEPLAEGGAWYSTWGGEESWADGWRSVTCWKARG